VFNHELYASAFARAVELMRERSATKDQQKAALRALVALGELAAATLRLYEGVLSVDDVAIPSEVPHVGVLVERMHAHRVSELLVGRQSGPAELLALLRGLAAQPGEGGTIKERLRDAHSTRIMVVLEQGPAAERRAVSVTQAFELTAIEEHERAGATAPPVPTAEPEPAAPPEEVEPDPVLSEWEFIHSNAGDVPAPGIQVVLDELPELPPQEPAVAPEPARKSEPAVPALPIDEDTPVGTALAAVVLDPYGFGLLDRLTVFSEHVARALREDQTEAALRALAVVIDIEPGAPEGTPRNSYGIVLKRTLTRDVLAQVAQCLLNPALMDAAAKVLRRGRGDGADVLLGLLATAEGLRERKAYMAVLTTIPDGAERALAMLNHEQWFVVRNITELIGELRIEAAVQDLGRILNHSDQRVRRVAAVALAKVGSVATVEPLRRALKEGSPEVRSLIASSIGGPHARALAMPLVALAESETDLEVQREYFKALGRIGTAEAVQALARAVEPGGKLIGRKNPAIRLAALDGLRLAGPAAAAIIDGLAKDSDRGVREAAIKLAAGRSG
jgi:HEAT repeat protein